MKSLKQQFLESEVQEVHINQKGEVLYSDNIFFEISLHSNIADFHMFFDNFSDLTLSLPEKIAFPCINFHVDKTEKIIDIVVLNKAPNYCIFLFDLTEHYQESHPIVQAKNEAIIQQYKLQFEKQLAEAKATFKNSFLENLNHEIRNPLNKMLVFLEDIKDSKLGYEQDQTLKAAYHNGLHIKALMEDLLDISKIEQGTIKAKKVNFNLSILLSNLKKQYFQNKLDDKNLFSLEIEKNIPRKLVGDPRRINQILFNLIDYALSQSPKNPVILHVSSKKVKEFIQINFSVLFTLKKNENLNTQTAFNTYHQLAMDKVSPLGNEVGLKIVKELTMLLDGKATIEKVDAKNDKFSITLPFKEQKQVKNKITNLKGTGVYFSKNVLALEDQLENQFMLMKLFLNNDKGYALDFAKSLEDIKTLESKKKYTIILLNEKRLEFLSNLELLFSKKKEKPIFFITCNKESEKLTFLTKNPNIHILKKPFSKKELFSKMGHALLS